MAAMTARDEPEPFGYRWRSSTPFIISCIAIALFTESFLYGFIVPILPEILQGRNGVDPSDIQRVTYQILTLYGGVSVGSAVFIGELADRAGSRRVPLVIALGIALVGTLTLAASTKLWGVYLGRAIQGIGGTAAWIVGLATLRASIDGRNIGKAFGLVHSFVSVGALSGPAAAGLLLEVTGYWITWASALSVIVLDIAMRLLMLEQRSQTTTANSNTPATGSRRPAATSSTGLNEDSALIPDATMPSYDSVQGDPNSKKAEISTSSFYKILFSKSRVLAAISCSVVYSSMLASYATTIPTHVKFAFGWGSLPTGLLFLGLQGPTIIFSPICGWLRDKIGTKLPATIGFMSLAPLLWLLGAADQKQFPWAKDEDSAKATYITAVIGIGCVTNLMSSIGIIELTSAVDELEAKQPGVFGANGGYSRTYSLSNLSFATGLLLGPLLSGALTESIGYYYMNTALACICVFMSVVAFSFLGGKSPLQRDRGEENIDE
ncbi:hypothetical protein TWF281_001498 [Arthrobotrys megalospora]